MFGFINRPRRLFAFGLVLALTFAFGAQCVWFARANGQTYDEGITLASGVWLLEGNHDNLNAEHPPVSKLLAALPVKLLTAAQVDFATWRSSGESPFGLGREFLYGGDTGHEQLLWLGRLPSIALSVLTVLLVGVWAYRLWGGRAALLALSLAAFDPNLIAYGSLIGHDGPLTFFSTLMLFGISELIKDNRIRWLGLAGVAGGLALGTKYSATYVLLVACIVPVAVGLRCGRAEAKPAEAGLRGNTLVARLVQVTLLVAIALLVIRVVYYPASYPAYLAGLRAQLGHQSHGHPAFLLGEISRTGWWSYFPIALAVKEPPLTLLLALVSLSCVRLGTAVGRAWFTVALPAGLLLLGLLAVRVNIGVRYALPLVPLLIVLASRVATFSPPRWVGWVLSLGLVHHAAAAVRVAPHDIAFFSDLVGGPKNGHRILADSNLDWGQDIQTLGRWLAQHEPPRRLYLSYFGTALPEAYGVHYRPALTSCAHVAPWGPESEVDGPTAGRELLAISEMNVQGVFFREPNPYAWLATKTPIAVLGHSIRVYDVSHDMEAKQRLEASSEERGLAR
jgi:hypothetical protein